MSYLRVIPRDLFNESKLLKCLGQLSLKILDGMLPSGVAIQIEEDGQPFEIQLTDDGYLYIANWDTFVNGSVVRFCSAYNSKSNYPLYCVMPDTLELIRVFDEAGEFDEEFVTACLQLEGTTNE